MNWSTGIEVVQLDLFYLWLIVVQVISERKKPWLG